MNRALPPCCTLFLITALIASAQTGPSADAAAESNLQKMETELAMAEAAHDTAPFTKYIDDNIVALGPGWHASRKADVLEGIKRTDCTTEKPTLTGFSFKWITSDVVLVSYMESYSVTCQGKTTPTTERDNSLWQKKGGQWMAVFHQATAEMPASPATGS